MTATVAGIDPALGGTGLADTNGRTYRITATGRTGQDAYDRIPQIVDRLEALLLVDEGPSRRPSLVVLEAYAGNSPGRLSVIRSIEMGAALRLRLRELDLPFVDVAPTTLKVYATGNGRADKADVIAAIPDRMGVDYPQLSDDEADALWLRDVGLWAVGDPAATGPHPEGTATSIGGLADRMRTGLAAAGIAPREDG